jgi:hypothetical protein
MLSGQLQGGYRQDTLGLGREGEADLAAHLTTGLGDKRPHSHAQGARPGVSVIRRGGAQSQLLPLELKRQPRFHFDRAAIHSGWLEFPLAERVFDAFTLFIR